MEIEGIIMNYTDGIKILRLCDEFEKISKKLYGDYKVKAGIEAHRKILNNVRNIVQEDK